MKTVLQFQSLVLLTLMIYRTCSANGERDICADLTCDCESYKGTYQVSCRDIDVQDFMDIVKNIPRHTTKLYVKHLAFNGEFLELRDGPFSHLNNILELELSYCNIKFIGANAFEGFELLESLRLSGNQLSSIFRDGEDAVGIHPEAFRVLRNLRVLYLDDNNDLTEPPVDICSSCPHLTHLDIGSNNIVSLKDSLQSCENMQELVVSNNRFTILTSDDFKGLQSVRHLDISRNSDAELTSDVFAGLGNLRQLLMADVRRGIPPYVLTPLQELKLLDVSGLGLKCLDTYCDDGIFLEPVAKSLTLLNLTGNALWKLEHGAFRSFTSLQALYLDNMGFKYASGTFEGLNELTDLSLDGNPFGLSVTLAGSLPKLEDLSCDGCTTNISALSEVLQGMPNLQQVNLADNDFTTIRPETFARVPKAEINVENNPWICNCSMYAMLEAIKEKRVNMDIVCAYPESVAGRKLQELAPGDLDGCSAPRIRGCCDNALQPTYGTNLTLQCTVVGTPEADIVWRAPDSSQLPDYRSNLSNNGQLLTIDYLTEDDAGVFTCEATNEIGKTTMHYDINIQVRQSCPLPSGCDCTTYDSATCSWLPYQLVARTFQSIPTSIQRITFLGDIRQLKYVYFTDIPWLTHINLAQCNISSMEGDSFISLNSLRQLWLDGNKITQLSGNLFNGLNQLNEIQLQENLISRINVGVFSGCSSLSYLDLSSNQITTLEPGLFDDLVNLKKLFLGHNDIRRIDIDTFLGLSGIQFLSFASNQRLEVTRFTFTYLDNLNTLDIQNISSKGTFDNNILERLDSLESLHFGYNQIKCIKCINWKPVASKLRTLNLDGNLLYSILGGSFQQFRNLLSLSLRDASIHTVDIDAFQGLNRLRDLILNGNNITTIKGGAFRGLTALKTLSLSSSNIESIEDDLFDNLYNLTTLYLQNNRLTVLSGNVFKPLTLNAAISLEGNPWQCNCSMFDFKRWSVRYRPDIDIVCHQPLPPMAQSGVLLADVADSHLPGCKSPKIAECCIQIIEKSVGENLTLQCKATGIPKPNITYHVISGNPLPSRVTYNRDRRTIHLSNIETPNSGIFVCGATNFLGQQESVFNIKVLSAQSVSASVNEQSMRPTFAVGIILGIIGLFSLIIAVALFYKLRRAQFQYRRMATDSITEIVEL